MVERVELHLGAGEAGCNLPSLQHRVLLHHHGIVYMSLGWVGQSSTLRDSPKRTMQRASPPEGKPLALAKQLSTLLLRTFLRSIMTHKWMRWGKKKRWFPAIWFWKGGERAAPLSCCLCRTEPQSWKERRRGLCIFQGGNLRVTNDTPRTLAVLWPTPNFNPRCPNYKSKVLSTMYHLYNSFEILILT